MQSWVSYIGCAFLIVILYIHNSEIGADHELEALNQIRNSSGYLIKYYKDER